MDLVEISKESGALKAVEKVLKVLVVLSPIVAAASFLTLCNTLVVTDPTVGSIGLAITAVCLVVFVVSLLYLIVTRMAGMVLGRGARNWYRQVGATGTPGSGVSAHAAVQASDVGTPAQPGVVMCKAARRSASAPLWYQYVKSLLGIGIVLGIYIGVPVGMFLNSEFRHDPSALLLAIPTVLVVLIMPIPFGLVVYPLTAIGIWLVLFRRKRWVLLDSLALMLVVLLGLAFLVFTSSGNHSAARQAESIKGNETVRVTVVNDGGKPQFGVGLCITSRIQVPRDDVADMICGVTDSDGRVSYNVKPGKYYLYFDLRTRDEYRFDPKYPNERIEWEVLPQSTNEIRFMVTSKNKG